MTLSLNFNIGAQRAHSNLMSVDRLLQKSIERLSSGERVRRAGEDPAAMVLSNGMRHQLAGISQSIQNCEEGVSMVQTSEGAADNISSLLTRMRALALRAANAGANDVNQLQAVQDELDNAIRSITRIAQDTKFGKVSLLQGDISTNTLSSEATDWYSSITHDARRLPGSITADSTMTMGAPTAGTAAPGHAEVNLAANTLTTAGLTTLVQNGVALSTLTAGTTMTITGPSGTSTIALGTAGVTDTLGGVLTAINTATTTTGVTANYVQSTGLLTLDAAVAGPFSVAINQTMSGGTAGLLDSSAGTTATAVNTNTFATTPQRGHLEVLLDGAPAGTTFLTNLTQNGTAFSGSMTAGTTLTVTGPRGSSVVSLSSTTTVNQAVTDINAVFSATGVTAAYDASTGVFALDAEGAGNFNVSVNNTMETGGAAFLDAAAGTTISSIMSNTLVSATSDLRRETMGVVLRTGAGVVPAGSTAIQGLVQNGTTLSAVSGSLTVTGVTGSASIAMTTTMTIDDLVARVNAVSSQTGVRAQYDSTLGELKIENIGFGRGILSVKASADMSGGSNVALLDLNPASATANSLIGPRDIYSMTFVSRSAPAVTGFPSATDSLQGLEVSGTKMNATDGQSFTIFGSDGTQDTLEMKTPKTGAELAEWVSGQPCTPALVWTAGANGSGTLVFDPTGVNTSLAVTTNTTAQDIATFLNPLNAGGTPSNLTMAIVDGSLRSTFNDGINPPTVASTVINGTTIQDVMDFINNNDVVTGLSATYNTGTGALSVTSNKGSFNLASESMTTSSTDLGLLDLNTASMTSTGATKTSSAPNATMTVAFTDAGGTARSVVLTQQPGIGGGLSFINLNAGPEMHPPFSGWLSGAFKVTVKDSTTAGDFNATLEVTTADQTATRTSNVFIHSGPEASQRIVLEIGDMRAAALGYSAFRDQVASTDANKPLVTKKITNLQDLLDSQALIGGNAAEALSIIDGAIDEVSDMRGHIGAIQANAIEATSSTLQESYNNLSDAQSRIRDTDFAWESAQYARNQVIFQAATAMLAQANQMPQSVVDTLFR